MPKVFTPDDASRASPNYAEAKELLKQKREVLCRLNTIHSRLRELQEKDPNAVTAAAIDTPVRNPQGRPRRT